MESGGLVSRRLCVSSPADVRSDELFEGKGSFEQMHMLDVVQDVADRKRDESCDPDGAAPASKNLRATHSM